MQSHLHQCEYSSALEGRCVCPFSGCNFIGTYRKLYDHASSGHSGELQMIECGETMPISFANHQRVVLKEQSRGGGELIVVDRLIQPHGAHFNVRCISPNVRGMGNFSWKLTVCLRCTLSFERSIIARANSVSSQLPPEPFVVPSFMGNATELLILINRVESVV
ncbi:E3 ubiquitin-protein ligase SINA-like 1 [Raphanus sativus]|uniref:E3 ubiquitin-protein ligase SINA-like 1 n=1 Tax=Raphanus sativus TaxID=3726 RepID=A0A9W3C772_RAPSA|nr:E3 ubiquitin-protein ligase SINA-like 1 [Raphanus sativus]